MSKKEKKERFPEFKLPKRKQPVFRVFKGIFKHIYHAKVESEIRELPDKAIIASIHSAKNGPIVISMSYPKFHSMWGHHAMLGSYKERFKYLRNVLYIQKLHKNKFVATLKATYEALFSIFIYRGMHIIGTYTDMRFLSTIKYSMEVLDDNASIVIYPEDSSKGYYETVHEAFPGFVMLALSYYQKRGEDVPVIPAYVSTKKHRFVLGEPRYIHELEGTGLSKQEMANLIRDDINNLYYKYIETDAPVEVKVENAPVRTKEYYEKES